MLLKGLNHLAFITDDPLPIAAEGAGPQPGHWPEVTKHTPPVRMVARPGNGFVMREDFIARGLVRPKPELTAATEQAAAE